MVMNNIKILQDFAIKQGFNENQYKELLNDYNLAKPKEQQEFLLSAKYGVKQKMQQGGGLHNEQDQIMQIIQQYAQATQQDPNQIIQQLQQLQPEEQNQALQQMMQELQSSNQESQNTEQIQEIAQFGAKVSKNGLYDYPYENVIVPTNNTGRITMKNIDYPVDSYNYDTGDYLTEMQPNKEYQFDGVDNVLEIPKMQFGNRKRKLIKTEDGRYKDVNGNYYVFDEKGDLYIDKFMHQQLVPIENFTLSYFNTTKEERDVFNKPLVTPKVNNKELTPAKVTNSQVLRNLVGNKADRLLLDKDDSALLFKDALLEQFSDKNKTPDKAEILQIIKEYEGLNFNNPIVTPKNTNKPIITPKVTNTNTQNNNGYFLNANTEKGSTSNTGVNTSAFASGNTPSLWEQDWTTVIPNFKNLSPSEKQKQALDWVLKYDPELIDEISKKVDGGNKELTLSKLRDGSLGNRTLSLIPRRKLKAIEPLNSLQPKQINTGFNNIQQNITEQSSTLPEYKQESKTDSFIDNNPVLIDKLKNKNYVNQVLANAKLSNNQIMFPYSKITEAPTLHEILIDERPLLAKIDGQVNTAMQLINPNSAVGQASIFQINANAINQKEQIASNTELKNKQATQQIQNQNTINKNNALNQNEANKYEYYKDTQKVLANKASADFNIDIMAANSEASKDKIDNYFKLSNMQNPNYTIDDDYNIYRNKTQDITNTEAIIALEKRNKEIELLKKENEKLKLIAGKYGIKKKG